MTPITAAWIGTAMVLAMFVGAHVMYWMDAHRLRRDTSRFRMFAVRDHLIRLVASRQMNEDDLPWQVVYQTVNGMLDLSYDKTMLSITFDSVRHAWRASREGAAEHLRSVDAMLVAGAQKAPEFAEVIKETEVALATMTRARTPRWQWWVMVLLFVLVFPPLVLRSAMRRAFFRPSVATAAVRFSVAC